MFRLLPLLAISFFLVFLSSAYANPGYGSKEKKACIHCHNRVSGGGGLNGTGNTYLREGHKFPKPKEEKKEEPQSNPPTTETTAPPPPPTKRAEPTVTYRPETDAQRKEREARLVAIDKALAAEEKKKALRKYKRVIATGKKLFVTVHEKLSGNGKSCIDCHTKKKVAKAIRKYPRWHRGLKRMVTYDRMIRLCIYHRMKGKPLEAESDYTLALAAYLKEVAAGRVK